jgi:hypothetical protein
MEHENLGIDVNGEGTSGLNHEGESGRRYCQVVATKRVMSVERSGQVIDVETSKGQLATGGTRGFDGGRQLSTDSTSRMNREVQVRICERLGVQSPGPTRLTSQGR